MKNLMIVALLALTVVACVEEKKKVTESCKINGVQVDMSYCKGLGGEGNARTITGKTLRASITVAIELDEAGNLTYMENKNDSTKDSLGNECFSNAYYGDIVKLTLDAGSLIVVDTVTKDKVRFSRVGAARPGFLGGWMGSVARNGERMDLILTIHNSGSMTKTAICHY